MNCQGIKRIVVPIIFAFAAFWTQSVSAQNCSVNAGIDQTICINQGSFNLSGSVAGNIQGTPTWSQVAGPSVNIVDPTDLNTGITGFIGGNTYTFRLTSDCTDGSTQFQEVDVVVEDITEAEAGPDVASCPDSSGSLVISANTPLGAGETGAWSIVGGNPAGVTIDFPNSPTTTISLPQGSAGATTLQWTITGTDYAPGQFCESTDTMTVTNYGGETPVTAGPDQALDNCYTLSQSTNLNASFGGNGLNGQEGTWSFVSGPSVPSFADENNNTTNVSNLIEGTYVLRWSVVGSCASGTDTMTITVDPASQDITPANVQNSLLRFCDPSITTATLQGAQPQFAGETVQWVQTSGPGVTEGGSPANLLTPANNTTQVTGLVSPSTYVFSYTISNASTGCSDTQEVTINYSVDPITISLNGGSDISAACGATQVSIPFTATGEGTTSYAIISGPSGSALVDPTNYTNTGSSPFDVTFDVEGTYAVQVRRAVNGSVQTGCDVATDVINVNISLVPTAANAGTGQVLACNVSSTALAGNAFTTGKSLWSQLSGPNTATISDPFARITNVTGLVPGIYEFQYAISGGNACSPSAESTVTVEVSSDAPITTSAGPDQTVCFATPINLDADDPTAPNLVGTWTVVSAPVGATIVFEDANDPKTLVSGLDDPNETYEFQWMVENPNDAACPPPASDTVVISTNSTQGPTPSVAGPDQCIATGTPTVTLAGNAPAVDEQGTWTAVPAVGISFADANLFNTTATISVEQSYILTWTIEKIAPGCQSSSDEVEITIGPAASADAGPDQTACASVFTMAATSSTGSGEWTQVSGPGGYTIDDSTSPTAQFTFGFSGQYVFEWTVNSGSCSTASDQITLDVGIPPTTATVGADQVICNATNTVLSGNAFNPAIESGFWTILSGAPNTPTITDVTDPNSAVTGLVTGSYTFRWNIVGDPNCPSTFADLVVDVFAPANAGDDLDLCEVSSFLLEATFGSTGTWTQVSTTGPNAVIVQNPANSNVAEVTITPGNTYVFEFTTDYAGCSNLSDQVTVESSTAPSVDPDAGADQILCIGDLAIAGQTTLAGNTAPVDVDTATWTIVTAPSGSTAVVDSPNDPASTVSGLTVPGIYILEWNFESGNCSTTADVMRIELFEAPSAADAGADQTNACQLEAQLDAVDPAVGIGTWTITTDPSAGDVVIDSPNSPTSTLSNITATGTYVFTWTVTNGTTFIAPSACAPTSDTVSITFTDDPPTVPEAGPDQEFCSAEQTNLAANTIAVGTGIWTQTAGPGVTTGGTAATIVSATNPGTLVLNLEPGTYEFTWTASNGGCYLTDTMEVVIIAEPTEADAGVDQNIAQFDPVVLAANTPTNGTGAWTQISGPTTLSFDDDTDPNTQVFGADVGTYVLEWTVSNGLCSDDSDQMEFTIIGLADLELTKTISPTSANIGDTVTFTLSVLNNSVDGTADATGIELIDRLPDGYSLVLGTVSDGGVYNPGNLTISWSGLSVTNGSTGTVTYDAVVTGTGNYTNTAEITAMDQIDPDSSVNNDDGDQSEDDEDSASITLQTADLSLTKGVSSATASVGETLTFTLTVSNAGTTDATGVEITDNIPAGFTIATINNGGVQSGSSIVWSGQNVATAAPLVLTYTATVNAPTGASGEYNNTAEITASDFQDPDSSVNNDDGDQSEDDEAAASISLVEADLEVSKSASASTANTGDVLTFTVSVFNDDAVETGDATGVDLVDQLPSGFTLVPGTISNGGVYNAGDLTVSWSDLSIANGATLNLTYQVSMNASGPYTNTVEITASDLADPDSTVDNDDGDQSEDDEAAETVSLQTADLSLAKGVSSSTASVGETLTFTLTVSNAGTTDATGVEITDNVPAGFTIATINNGGMQSGSTIVWSGQNVATAAPLVLTYTATVNAPTGASGEYNNTAEITASDFQDPDSSVNNDDGDQSEDDEAAASITLEEADLEVSKSASASTVNAGDILTFTVSVFNNDAVETGDATGVDLVDQLPSGFTLVPGTISNGGVYNAGDLTVSWSDLSIANGATLNLTYQVSVNDSGPYTNTVEITASDLGDPDSTVNNDDGDQSEDDEAVETISLQTADLSLAKTVAAGSSATPNIGENVVFELTVTNAGAQTATNVEVTDQVPNGLSIVSVNNGGTQAGNTLRWTIASLPVGSTTVTYEVQVLSPTGAANEYLNIAEITASDQLDPDSSVNNDDGDQSEDDEDNFTLTPQQADLSLQKSVSDSNPNAGDTVTYSISLSNAGPAAATGVAVEDLIPSGLSGIGAISNGGAFGAGSINWSGLSVPVGTNTLVLTYTAVIQDPTGLSGEYSNVVEITASDQFDPDSTPANDDGDQSEDEEDELSISVQQADLSIVKSVNNTQPEVGETLTFTLTVTNAGPDQATGVAVEDILPAGFNLVSVNNGGTASVNTASWTGLSVLANGGSITLTYTATVNAPTGALNEYLNQAQITASDQFDPDSDPTTGNTVDEDGNGSDEDDDETFLEVIPRTADLRLTKIVVDGDTSPAVGSEISFEITVYNDGPDQTDLVVVSDLLPSGFDFVLYSATSGIYDDMTGVWDVGSVSSGGNQTLVIDALVNTTGNYTNVAEIIMADVYDADSTPNNNVLAEDDQAQVVVTPVAQIDVSLSKSVDELNPNVGDNVVFTLVVENQGPSEATGVVVTDVLPSGFSYVSDTGGGAYSNTTGLWTIGALAASAQTQIQITATVLPTGGYVNVAEITAHNEADIDSSPNNDLLTEDDQDQVVVQPVNLVDLEVVKTANTMTPNVGQSITFTIVVSNNGPSDATEVVVTDLLASGYQYSSSTVSTGVYEPLNGSWTIGGMSAANSETLTISALVLPDGEYSNTAELTDLAENDIDSEPANNDDTEDDQSTIEPVPVQLADLELSKTVDNSTPRVGEQVTFSIDITNQGPSRASGITVQDILPAGYVLVNQSATAGTYDVGSGNWVLNTDLPAGTSERLLLTVEVGPTGPYTNVAEVMAADQLDPDASPGNGDASEDDQDDSSTTPIPVADLSLVKSVDELFPDVASNVVFRLELTNDGPSTATGIQVADLLASGYTFVSDNGGGTYNPTTGIWSPADLASGATVSLEITAMVNSGGDFENTAEVIAVNELDPDSSPGNGLEEEDDQSTVNPQPRIVTDISLDKDVDTNNPSVGSNVVFTITVVNDGPSDATGLVVEDILNSGYAFVSANASIGNYDPVIGSWDIAFLANGGTATLDITAEVLRNGEYSNTAELIALDTYDPDSSPDNNLNSEDDQDTVNPIPSGSADLSLTKTVDNPTPNVGDLVEFTLNVNNAGESSATGIEVSEVLPVGLAFRSYTTTAGIYDPTSGIWALNTTVLNGTTETLILIAEVLPPTGTSGEYLNSAFINASDQSDPNSDPGDNVDSDDLSDGLEDDDEAEVELDVQQIDLAVTKTVNEERPRIGQTVQFTITVQNVSLVNASGIGVEEILPTGYRLISAVASRGAYEASDGLWSIDQLGAGEQATLVLDVEVLDIDDYLNQASFIYADQIDTNPANDSGEAGVSPTCLVIYNEFSPNGDGVNEFFRIDCISQYPNNKLQVYNRWGNLVFEQEGYNNTWDGTSTGRVTINESKFLPVGTYYYILNLGDGSEPLTDWLYINR